MDDDYRRCQVCRKFGWFGEKGKKYGAHVCLPKWECRPEWYDDDDWWNIFALDSEQAAEEFAERYDCEGGEYSIVGGKFRGDVIVLVRKPGEETCERWSIEAEAVPTYRATKLKAASPQETPHD